MLDEEWDIRRMCLLWSTAVKRMITNFPSILLLLESPLITTWTLKPNCFSPAYQIRTIWNVYDQLFVKSKVIPSSEYFSSETQTKEQTPNCPRSWENIILLIIDPKSTDSTAYTNKWSKLLLSTHNTDESKKYMLNKITSWTTSSSKDWEISASGKIEMEYTCICK